ncbi:Hyccin [Vigna unguiculata]|uniref:Hyccin n=1 Tax=Vigna unguiculata TaxID=3917 RepID=A0A4D6L6D6_VIGUN|nr:Hyccin [Vigna unguiculata]
MEFHRSDSSSSPSSSMPTPNTTDPKKPSTDPMHSWWESVSKARSRIHALAAILPSSSHDPLSSLADSDRPALSLLSSSAAYAAVSASLSGSHSDPLCHWLYDTFLSADPHLRLVVLSFVPLLTGLYLSRIHSPEPPSLAGFEAVLLALYAAETRSRNGKPLLVTIPDLSHPSIYHAPLRKPQSLSPPSVGLISPPLEPQLGVKSTKRPAIVGVALHSFFSQISHMPAWSKLDFCQFAAAWAGSAPCPCRNQFDDATIPEHNEIRDAKGERIPLPWEILQPSLRILGHCLLGPLNSQDVKDAASFAVRCLYARASHDLVPQAILATRSLIQLDVRTAEAAKANAGSNSNSNTPTKVKKPEILLVSK